MDGIFWALTALHLISAIFSILVLTLLLWFLRAAPFATLTRVLLLLHILGYLVQDGVEIVMEIMEMQSGAYADPADPQFTILFILQEGGSGVATTSFLVLVAERSLSLSLPFGDNCGIACAAPVTVLVIALPFTASYFLFMQSDMVGPLCYLYSVPIAMTLISAYGFIRSRKLRSGSVAPSRGKMFWNLERRYNIEDVSELNRAVFPIGVFISILSIVATVFVILLVEDILEEEIATNIFTTISLITSTVDPLLLMLRHKFFLKRLRQLFCRRSSSITVVVPVDTSKEADDHFVALKQMWA